MRKHPPTAFRRADAERLAVGEVSGVAKLGVTPPPPPPPPPLIIVSYLLTQASAVLVTEGGNRILAS